MGDDKQEVTRWELDHFTCMRKTVKGGITTAGSPVRMMMRRLEERETSCKETVIGRCCKVSMFYLQYVISLNPTASSSSCSSLHTQRILDRA